MNTKKFIIFTLLFGVACMIQAQTFTLSGKVSDDEGNAIELATISFSKDAADKQPEGDDAPTE